MVEATQMQDDIDTDVDTDIEEEVEDANGDAGDAENEDEAMIGATQAHIDVSMDVHTSVIENAAGAMPPPTIAPAPGVGATQDEGMETQFFAEETQNLPVILKLLRACTRMMIVRPT